MSNRRQLSADTKMANRLRSKGHPFNKDIIQTQINADFTICVNLRSYLKQTD